MNDKYIYKYIKMSSIKKTCKDYYQSPVWRESHLAKLNKKEQCPKCCRIISRVNMFRHKRSSLCYKFTASKLRDNKIMNQKIKDRWTGDQVTFNDYCLKIDMIISNKKII